MTLAPTVNNTRQLFLEWTKGSSEKGHSNARCDAVECAGDGSWVNAYAAVLKAFFLCYPATCGDKEHSVDITTELFRNQESLDLLICCVDRETGVKNVYLLTI